MALPKEYIGTSEEIEPVLKRMPKQQFLLVPLISEEAEMSARNSRPFYETTTPDEWEKNFALGPPAMTQPLHPSLRKP